MRLELITVYHDFDSVWLYKNMWLSSNKNTKRKKKLGHIKMFTRCCMLFYFRREPNFETYVTISLEIIHRLPVVDIFV